LEGLIGDLVDPKMNWKQIITKYVRSILPYDNSFTKPNKKFLANNLILPGTIKESIDIVIALDTSGSISDDELRQFLSEMKGIAKSHSNVKMTIIQADSEIHKVSDINTQSISELVNFEIKGRGGTAHEPVFEYIKKKIVQCKLLIAFTDGYSDIDSLDKPNYDVIWGLTSNGTDKQMKFGKVVRL
jgi:predicted metal-dependent peptidase